MSEAAVRIPKDAGISEILSIKERLDRSTRDAKAGETVSVDLSDVVNTDSSLAQLLIAMKAESVAKGFKMAFTGGDGGQAIRALLGCDQMDSPCGEAGLPKGGER